tara:strand:- start:20627 stop:21082 length:456 start_codon:yes stop_codon:yes gene_type:complete
MNTEIKENSMGFEAVKVSMSQDKNGIILRLNVHPNDCPPELHTDWVGTRYMVGMCKLNDFDQPDVRLEQKNIERMISSAGLLCRNEEFWRFLQSTQMDAWDGDPYVESEEHAVSVVHHICNIKSRSELRNNVSAREDFTNLREEFFRWKKG